MIEELEAFSAGRCLQPPREVLELDCRPLPAIVDPRINVDASMSHPLWDLESNLKRRVRPVEVPGEAMFEVGLGGEDWTTLGGSSEPRAQVVHHALSLGSDTLALPPHSRRLVMPLSVQLPSDSDEPFLSGWSAASFGLPWSAGWSSGRRGPRASSPRDACGTHR